MCSIGKHKFATSFRSSVDLFQIEESEIDTIQCLSNESFAACGCYQNKTQSYFVDHDPLSGSFLCRNKNQNHCRYFLIDFNYNSYFLETN